MEFNYKEIENKWKKVWDDSELYKVDIDTDKEKFYVLDMFPYPSGAGLHVGHPLGYIASDIFSRYKRQQGYNVLHPMGFDAFGLPAEEYAIATGVHPADSTRENIERYKAQLSNIGFSFDWSRQVVTCEPDYYKWTQWIFSQLFNHYYDLDKDKAVSIEKLEEAFSEGGSSAVRAFCSDDQAAFTADQWNAMSSHEKSEVLSSYRLAYRKVGYVNWCEALGTVLANDQIKDGVSERGGHPVERKAMTQWYLRITAYAERLLDGLDEIEWSSSLKTIQKNWIGKSKGARIFFEIKGHSEKIEVFTTRPDTIFRVSFMVLSPEHAYVEKIVTEEQRTEVEDYLEYVKSRSERDRLSDVKEVSGAFTGAYAKHPFTGKEVPIWIGEYVLMDYGTGAIMAVPADDDRDNAFAEKYDLPIIQIVDRSAYPEAKREDKVGKMINSDFLNGLEVKEAITAISQRIKHDGIGELKVNYKMRDANFSRQRYWGEPFPVIYDKDGVPSLVESSGLPVRLPDTTDDFKPTKDGQSPLSRIKDWVNLDGFTRETDTMPAVAGSSWYFLRYMDPANPNAFASEEALGYWKDIDLYVGGAEHAVSHLLYARFWHKFLYDTGHVPTQEPFKKLINQGMIQGVIEFIALKKEEGQNKLFISADALEESEEYARIPVHIDFVKDYGQENSYLDIEGIEQFVNWRKEYANAEFKNKSGRYSLNDLQKDRNLADSFRLTTISEVGKMSKRYYNVVNPDDVVNDYGADCFRLYEMFLGPVEQSKPWDTQGIEGVSKFLKKFWGLFHNDDTFTLSSQSPDKKEMKILHQTIKKVTEDIEQFSFNTAISAMMICVNDLRKLSCNKEAILSPLVKLIAPFAPFMAEELWSKLGNDTSIHLSEYPEFDEKYLVEDEIEYPVCVNGKKRFMQTYPSDISKSDIESNVPKLNELQKWIEGKQIIKIIVVPGRMINVVVK